MTYKVQVFAGMRTETLYSGPSERFASIAYDSAISTVRFTGGTAAVQMRREENRKVVWTSNTQIEGGKRGAQSVRHYANPVPVVPSVTECPECDAVGPHICPAKD